MTPHAYTKADYIRLRGQDDAFYEQLVLDAPDAE